MVEAKFSLAAVYVIEVIWTGTCPYLGRCQILLPNPIATAIPLAGANRDRGVDVVVA